MLLIDTIGPAMEGTCNGLDLISCSDIHIHQIYTEQLIGNICECKENIIPVCIGIKFMT